MIHQREEKFRPLDQSVIHLSFFLPLPGYSLVQFLQFYRECLESNLLVGPQGACLPMSDLPSVVRLASLALGHDVSTSLPNTDTSADSSTVPNLQISNLGGWGL